MDATGNQFAIDFDAPAFRPSGRETSEAAAKDSGFKASVNRILAMRMLWIHGGLTDFELAEKTGLQQTSIGKRRGECAAAGLVGVVTDGEGNNLKRPAPSGSAALVWQLTADGLRYMKSQGLADA